MAYNRWISSNVPYQSVDILHEEEGTSDINTPAENDHYSELLKSYTRFRRGESDEEDRKRLEEDEQKRKEDEEQQRVETEEKYNKRVGVLKRISNYLSYNV